MSKNKSLNAYEKSQYLSAEDVRLWKMVAFSVKPFARESSPRSLPSEPEFEALLGATSVLSNPNKAQTAPLTCNTLASLQKKTFCSKDVKLAESSVNFHYRNNKLSLDVHNMTEQQAYEAVKNFLLLAQSRGERMVLIITGKGSAKLGTGVINKNLPLWLEAPFFAQIVKNVRYADISDGGAGAYYVSLHALR